MGAATATKGIYDIAEGSRDMRELLGGLASAEQELVRVARGDRRDLANLVWTAKEASAKARAGGLRLNVREAVVEPELEGRSTPGGWRPLRVVWPAGVDHGAWRREPGWVMAVVGR
jgi:4'-phosphopantetheinyl transferase superfamily